MIEEEYSVPLMPSVSATVFPRQFTKWSEIARQEPVLITRHGHPVLVAMSYREWELLSRQDSELKREVRILRAFYKMRKDWTEKEIKKAYEEADKGLRT